MYVKDFKMETLNQLFGFVFEKPAETFLIFANFAFFIVLSCFLKVAIQIILIKRNLKSNEQSRLKTQAAIYESLDQVLWNIDVRVNSNRVKINDEYICSTYERRHVMRFDSFVTFVFNVLDMSEFDLIKTFGFEYSYEEYLKSEGHLSLVGLPTRESYQIEFNKNLTLNPKLEAVEIDYYFGDGSQHESEEDSDCYSM
jgi:hypothetical protein